MPANKKTVRVEGIKQWSSPWAITLTLNPKMFHLNVLQQRNSIQGIINGLCYDSNIKMSLVCEMTQHYNCHFHGFVQVAFRASARKTIPHYVADALRSIKDLGFWCVKPIEDHQGWLNYCLKEYEVTKIALDGESPIISDHCNVLLQQSLQNLLSRLDPIDGSK